MSKMNNADIENYTFIKQLMLYYDIGHLISADFVLDYIDKQYLYL